MKVGCIIQGNLRVPLDPILRVIQPQVDVVVVSVWKDDEMRLPAGNYERILNDLPKARGVTNRNLQRYSTARGIERLSELGCTHVLKWRTDLLPTTLDVARLLRLSSRDTGNALGGRIVTGAFRHLSVDPDWFSSFPDLYSFSSIEAARLLWGDDEFDYSAQYNMPERMRTALSIGPGADAESFSFQGAGYSLRGIYAYDAHTEFYALFKDHLERRLGRTLDHRAIVENFFSLLPDDALGICWHDPKHPLLFRPIRQGYHLDWWTADSKPPKVYSFESMQKPFAPGLLGKIYWALPRKAETVRQLFKYLFFKIGNRP